jgi:hypothetical protein
VYEQGMLSVSVVVIDFVVNARFRKEASASVGLMPMSNIFILIVDVGRKEKKIQM